VVKISCIKSSIEVLLFFVYKVNNNNNNNNNYIGKFTSAVSYVKTGFVSYMQEIVSVILDMCGE
jgi:hypothetical protein